MKNALTKNGANVIMILEILSAIVRMPKVTPYVCRHTYCSNMAKEERSNTKQLKFLEDYYASKKSSEI